MKIRVLSDIHLNHGAFDPPPAGADVVVLAGDIGRGAQGVEWANQAFPDPATPVVYVPGNHEFYYQEIHATLEAMHEAAAGHVYVLDDRSVEIEGVRFLGATLWTDFDLYGPAGGVAARLLARKRMPDFACVRIGARAFTPLDSALLHNASRNWMEAMFAEDADTTRTVVVTHHAPSEQSIAARYRAGPQSALNPAFASNLDALLGRPALWVHGHTHDSFDYRAVEGDGARVVCNPRGYYDEELNPDFDPRLLVEL